MPSKPAIQPSSAGATAGSLIFVHVVVYVQVWFHDLSATLTRLVLDVALSACAYHSSAGLLPVCPFARARALPVHALECP